MTTDRLSTVFGALADPTRRAILSRLATHGETSVTALAKPFRMSLPAVSKHLRVLEGAGLISRGRDAQWRPARLQPAPLKDVSDWVEHYRKFWEQRSTDWTPTYTNFKSRRRKMPAQKTANRPKAKAASGDRTLVIKRILDAPRDLVWKMWSDPEQAKNWWGPHGFTAPVVELDTRPGGKWRAMMRSSDGKEMWQHGVYREIVPPEKVSFTFIWDQQPDHEMLITITFVERGKKTEMTLQQTGFDSKAERDDHEGGWTESLERFAAYVKKS